MILADKIINLRKKNGWSQEELAEKMNVSRQAVSKWESAHSIPDLQKIIELAKLFGVTTDYLLKDEMESEEFSNTNSDTVRRISIEEANLYLEERKRASWKIGLATFLCILSPITLFVLSFFADAGSTVITETIMGIFGLGALFLFILCAIPIFLYCSFKNEPYSFLDQSVPFELEYGVKGLVTERKKHFRNTYMRCNIIATSLCIISPLPLILSGFAENGALTIATLGLLLLIVGIAVFIFITVGVQNASMQKLLQEGDYTAKKKRRSSLKDTVGFCYFGLLTAIYLSVSFTTNTWSLSWLIFAVGGVLFPIVMKICNYISDSQYQPK